MTDVETAILIGACAGIPVTVVGNWVAIRLGTYLRNVRARKRY